MKFVSQVESCATQIDPLASLSQSLCPHLTPLKPTIGLKACLLLFLGQLSLDNWLFLKYRQRTGRAWCFHHRRANHAVTDRGGIMTAWLPCFQEIQFFFQSFLVLCGTWPVIVLLGFFYGSISLIHFLYRNSCLRACCWGPQLRAALL